MSDHESRQAHLTPGPQLQGPDMSSVEAERFKGCSFMERRDTGRMGKASQFPGSPLKETTTAYPAVREEGYHSPQEEVSPFLAIPSPPCCTTCDSNLRVNKALDPWNVCTAPHSPSNSRYGLLSIYYVPALCLGCSLLSMKKMLI